MSQPYLNPIPLAYTTPPFPSLYWPFGVSKTEAKYLFTVEDIWRFTLYWTLITIPAAHIVVALTACITQFTSAHQRSQYLRSLDHHNNSNSSSHKNDFKKSTSADAIFHRSRDEKRNNTATTTTSNSTSSSNPTTTTTSPTPHRPSRPTPHSHSTSDSDSKPHPYRQTLDPRTRKLLGTSPHKEALQSSGLILALYILVGTIEATIAGSLVGVVLGAVYNSGYFRMSVWTPLCWGIINMLVLILASFRISGGL